MTRFEALMDPACFQALTLASRHDCGCVYGSSWLYGRSRIPTRNIGVESQERVSSVTVVTVTLNARDTIRLTLESVKSQVGVDVNHLVIDGLSHDDTTSIVREYSNARAIVGKDSGIYDAMDKGAQAATGDVLIFLNAGDMFYSDDVCTKICDFFNQSRADILFGNICPVYLRRGDAHDHSAFRAGEPLNLGYVRDRRRLYDESIHHQATFYRRKIFSVCEYRCPNPIATGEYNLLLQAVSHGFKIRYIDLIISRFALGGVSTGNFEEEWQRYVAAREVLRDLYCNSGQLTGDDIIEEFHREY